MYVCKGMRLYLYCVNVCMYMCVFTIICVNVFVSMCVNVCVYMCVFASFVCKCVCVYMCVFVPLCE